MVKLLDKNKNELSSLQDNISNVSDEKLYQFLNPFVGRKLISVTFITQNIAIDDLGLNILLDSNNVPIVEIIIE